jgi:hypothetical protein
MNNIILLKLFNGEMIIGEEDKNTWNLSCEIKTGYKLNNPRSVGIIPTMTGSVQIAMTSICAPFKVARLKKYIYIPNEQVMYELHENEIDNELINGYKSDISGIKIATSSDMTKLNESKPNEFIF